MNDPHSSPKYRSGILAPSSSAGTFVDGWSAIAPVEGWTIEHASQLHEHLLSVELPGL